MGEEETLNQILSGEIAALQDVMTTVRLNDGDILFRRGDPGDAFYIIESGQVRVFTYDEEGRELTLNTMGPGEGFGELALVDTQPRSASVSAIGATVLHRLSREDFLARVHTSPVLSQIVIRLLSQRARHMTDYIEWLGHWARLAAEGQYSQAMESIHDVGQTSDRALAAVTDAVENMVKAVQEREERLREEVAQLRIKIDDARRRQQVEEITETDYFQTLARQAQSLRRRTDE